jgi:hypothetical protein
MPIEEKVKHGKYHHPVQVDEGWICGFRPEIFEWMQKFDLRLIRGWLVVKNPMTDDPEYDPTDCHLDLNFSPFISLSAEEARELYAIDHRISYFSQIAINLTEFECKWHISFEHKITNDES